MNVTVIAEVDAIVISAGAPRVGTSRITASGRFDGAKLLADGATVECYINFGVPKYFLVPAGYVETESPAQRQVQRGSL